MARIIDLDRTVQFIVAGAVLVTFEVTDATDMDAEVFVMKNRPKNPMTGTYDAVFDHVATAAEMTSLPVGTANPDEVYYRTDEFSYTYANAVDADQSTSDLGESIDRLIDELNAAAGLPETTSYTFNGT